MKKPSIPNGMRDFAPDVVAKRGFILKAIKTVFRKYNFQQIETPAMENLSVLTDKYGHEGDQLLFKVLNSGDYLKGADWDKLHQQNTSTITPMISSKGLRYDLTVPFARYVAMNRHAIALPFRRFQIQPVWRADRPQKGRYREFYQCDADIIGTHSLLSESEIIAVIKEVCDGLNLPSYRIRVNHRGILSGLAEKAGIQDKNNFFSTLDKWDKIGEKGVKEKLANQGISSTYLDKVLDLLNLTGSNTEKIKFLSSELSQSEQATKGLNDILEIINFLSKLGLPDNAFELDTTLARGLSYYTKTIFEVVIKDMDIGSICGGGRYDNLTELFGLPGVSGVGASFGVDRLYDVMEASDLFLDKIASPSNLLITHIDTKSMNYGIEILAKIRVAGLCATIYPDCVKLKKQLDYAHKNKTRFVIIIGEDEMKTGQLTIKNMNTGEQKKCCLEEIIKML